MKQKEIEIALTMLRQQMSSKVYDLLKDAILEEFKNSESSVADTLLSLGEWFDNPEQDHDGMDNIKKRLANIALEDPEFLEQIKNMTLDGILKKDPITGCTIDKLTSSLYAASMLFPLQNNPENRFNVILQAFTETSEALSDLGY